MEENTVSREKRELVYLFLLHMGGYSWNKGSRRLEAALQYLLDLDTPEDHQIKEVYAEVAERTGGDWRAAERSLRYTIRKIWRKHTQECSLLFYHSTDHTECPTVSEFLFMFHTANGQNAIRYWIDTVETPNQHIEQDRSNTKQ